MVTSHPGPSWTGQHPREVCTIFFSGNSHTQPCWISEAELVRQLIYTCEGIWSTSSKEPLVVKERREKTLDGTSCGEGPTPPFPSRKSLKSWTILYSFSLPISQAGPSRSLPALFPCYRRSPDLPALDFPRCCYSGQLSNSTC